MRCVGFSRSRTHERFWSRFGLGFAAGQRSMFGGDGGLSDRSTRQFECRRRGDAEWLAAGRITVGGGAESVASLVVR